MRSLILGNYKFWAGLLILFIFTVCSKKTQEPILLQYDIFLVAGQSNTHNGLGYDPNIDASDERIFQLGRFSPLDYQILLAVEPLQHSTRKNNHIGFSLTFAKLYAERLRARDRQVLLVPCGSDGSSFRKGDWNRGNPLFNDAIDRINYCIEKFPGSRLKGILWHQGESDVGLGVAYKNALDGMIVSMRKNIKQSGNDSIPFIAGGLVPYWVNNTSNGSRVIDSIIRNLPNRLPFTGFADPLLPFVIRKQDDAFDPIHFDAPGQRELGKRYFSEYLKFHK
jgi:hypothetical protein